MPKRLNGYWKAIAIALVSMFAAGAVSWISFGANTINRDEAIEIVNTHSPYLEDRKLLNATLGRVSDTMDKQGKAMNDLSSTQAAQAQAIKGMTEEQKRMNERLDRALKDPH